MKFIITKEFEFLDILSISLIFAVSMAVINHLKNSKKKQDASNKE